LKEPIVIEQPKEDKKDIPSEKINKESVPQPEKVENTKKEQKENTQAREIDRRRRETTRRIA